MRVEKTREKTDTLMSTPKDPADDRFVRDCFHRGISPEHVTEERLKSLPLVTREQALVSLNYF